MKRRAVCVLLLLGLVATGSCGALEEIGNAPKDVTVQVNAPLYVSVKQEFVIEVRVQNTSSRPMSLNSIDVGDRYLQGVAIQKTEPAFRQSMHVPVVNMQSYEFGQTIPAGGELLVKLNAVAVKAGDYAADMSICINGPSTCASHPVRAVVE